MKLNVVSLSSNFVDDLVVVFCGSKTNKDKTQTFVASAKAPAAVDDLLKSLPEERFNGAEGDILFSRQPTAPHFLLLGIGETAATKSGGSNTGAAKSSDFKTSSAKSSDHGRWTAESARRWSALILGCMKTEKLKSASILSPGGISSQDATTGFGEGLVISNYKFTAFKEEPKTKFNVEKVDICVEKPSASLKQTLENAQAVGEAVNFARYLGDCPGNYMTPTQLGKEAENIAKGTSLKVQVWDKKRIEKEKMESFLGVSYGSDQEPKFICMEYRGGSAKQKPICFVGKGLTFDSGGISIKPSAGMEEMKFDMCGGAAVIAAMGAIAKMKLKINAIAYVPATENMPGPSANKPGDIRKARNGKTIEVNNTDAEGRLILADALVYACEQKPALILDTATLTGAMMVALGNTHTGFFTRNGTLRKQVEAAADTCGERVWAMPLVDDHVKDMRGTYADLTNLAPSRNAGSATATAFLEAFVDKDIPWAHFDIAGTAWNVSNRLPYITTKGASGAIVRTFIEMARNHK